MVTELDGWWFAVGVFAGLFVLARLVRLRRWRPPENPDADYGWKLFHVHWMPWSPADTALLLPMVASVLAALMAAPFPR